MTVSDVQIGHEGPRVLVTITTLDGQGLRLRPTPEEADLLATQLIGHAAAARLYTPEEPQ